MGDGGRLSDESNVRANPLGLGKLETAVLEVLWAAEGPQTVRAVLEVVATPRRLAYTTVQTVLEKLHRKGWAERLPDGRAFAYQPVVSREQAAATVLHSLLSSTDEVDTALLHFVEAVSLRERDVLRDALERLGGDGSPHA